MKKILYAASLLLLISCVSARHHNVISLTDTRLMNEVRVHPAPADGDVVEDNPPHFMWPDKYPHLGAVLDGEEEQEYKPKVTYRIRIARDAKFTKQLITGERPWAFFNPFRRMESGKWYWQYAFVDSLGKEEWSPVMQFRISKNARTFNPPSFEEVMRKYPKYHPIISLDSLQWRHIMEKNAANPEAEAYVKKAERLMKHPLKSLSQEIDTTNVVKLTDPVKRKSALIRESRKIVDREEAAIETLVYAYLLTKNRDYCREGMNRLREVLSWRSSKYLAGDFNLGTLLSVSTLTYDAFHAELTKNDRTMLLEAIRTIGGKFYDEYVNHLENRIADNHVWQMTYRILSMAAFATVNDLPEAKLWADYCYNEWVSRMPGLNRDGAWHNGDSYFHVNIKTLILMPAFYSRISGYNFFANPWYNKNALYVIYQQPPFSKSGGHGNSHERQMSPSGARVGYADALARECQNKWAAAYVKEIQKREPAILHKSFEAKPSDLTWYRCVTDKNYPSESAGLKQLPKAKVFNETGTTLMNTALGDYKKNAMLSFRSSPYGSTSHALANQNAFNTFYGGKAIFYSTGHRTGFTDDHCMYAYRNTRAHNTILVNGMGQKIGTEGYGWIPRFYEGEQISYVVGDASNAYGNVESELWLKRGKLSGTEFTPEKGWDRNRLKKFRRHIVELGDKGLFVVYDELEATEPVNWNYLLNTRELPMLVEENRGENELRITGRNKNGGVSVANLFASAPVNYQQTDQFFVPAVDWKKRLGKALENNYHLNVATENKERGAFFLNILDVHGNNRKDLAVKRVGKALQVGEWLIEANLNPEKRGALKVKNCVNGAELNFNYGKEKGKTVIKEKVNGKMMKKKLSDYLPPMEI